MEEPIRQPEDLSGTNITGAHENTAQKEPDATADSGNSAKAEDNAPASDTAGEEMQQPTEEEMKAVSPLGGLFPKWDRKNQSVLKIMLYCLLFIVILTLLGYFFSHR
ncbi:hypothetical protein [Zongyangia hominis]|uniref:Uncharacterized protein n=1 Tax=Zongyangia hominis TaxID=2763677 RepID=A0A926ECV7_9FIRM|nr:hypothetical protein [Zongyangia hominis]MBC8570728.1 hypothetical protein [Zongyangia hominis]